LRDECRRESDDKPDPRFVATPETLKKKGITDFQLDYATRLLDRLAPGGPVQTANVAPTGGPALQK
jgi:carboxyl-terminal processing protease